MKGMNIIEIQNFDSFYAEYTKHVERLHQQLKTVDEILSKRKTDTGINEYPSSPLA